VGSEKSLYFIPGKYQLLKQDQFSSSCCWTHSCRTKNWGSDPDWGPRERVPWHSCNCHHGAAEQQLEETATAVAQAL